MPELYLVTWDGRPFKKGFRSRQEAEAFAERWQGERYRSGMLKHGDKRDYFEVARDREAEQEFDRRYADAKAGKRQVVVYQQYVSE
jgi:hypothetical protein